MGSRLHFALISVTAAIALLAAIGAGSARAATDGSYQDVYTVASCAPGQVNNAPTFTSSTFGFMTVANDCGSLGGLQIDAPAGGVSRGASGQWSTETPSPSIRIIGVDATGMADCNLGSDGFNASYYYGDEGTNYGQPAITIDCHGASGNGAAGDLDQKIQSSRYLGWQASCTQATCKSTGANNLVFALEGITLEAQETTGPSLATPTPSIWSHDSKTGWVRASFPIPLAASDPSGVCSLSVTANGSALSGGYTDPAPDGSQWTQCHGTQISPTVNTTSYPSGAGSLTLGLSATNAAGASSAISDTFNLDNDLVTVAMSGPTTALSSAGTQYITATGSAGPSGVGSVTCSVNGGAAQTYSGAIARVPVSGIGISSVSCTAANRALDASGNPATSTVGSYSIDIQQPTAAAITFGRIVHPLKCRTVSERIMKPGAKDPVLTRFRRCHARTVKERVTIVVKRHGRKVRVKRVKRVVVLPHTVNQSKLQVDHGSGANVSGVLLLGNRTALGGQTVQVLTAPDNGLGQFTPAATVTTNADGSWRARLPAGPSRLVEAAFGGNATTAATVSPQISLRVPAKVKLLKITPAKVPWNHTVKIVGELEGGYLPPGGALVRLEIGQGKSVTTYGVREHVTSSRFTTDFQFGHGHPRNHVRFWFRIASLPESSYPFAESASGKEYVLVGGR